ncbi:MAG TPA: SGNH/GDSL hydrolase family protein [Tepidisphaeraceae bacterium]|jgi:lysophospholipase L1-like esterase|nr:SGNH/GDSL hydrolase family protein [Tepidisphaeraceae bacterium]
MHTIQPPASARRYSIFALTRRAGFALTLAFLLICVNASSAENPPSNEPNVQFRGSLDNCRIRFEKEKRGTVAFIGGSITEMNGYRPMVCDLLKRRFPTTDFKFIDAGVSSTCSTTGAFRLESDVLSKGPIDLFFIEFAVNDDQDAGHTRAECIRGMEGIIRHARRGNPNMDIVVTYFVNEGMLATFKSGKTPLTVEAHEVVAKHYDISTINLAREISQELESKKLTWKQYGGVHPAPFGNAICSHMIDKLLSQAWLSPLGAEAKITPLAMPAEPLDPLNYERGRFIDPADAKITDGWTIGVPDWKKLPGGKRERFTSIPMLTATELGAELTLKFDGTAIGAYVVAGPDAGIVEGSIDGMAFEPVDLFHRFSRGLHYPRTVMFAADLKKGEHTLTLRMSKETRSAGHAARIMDFVAN